VIVLKSTTELDAMHCANRVVHMALDAVRHAAAPGVSTAELDTIAEELIRGEGGAPAFKGYRGFPATLCTSVNDEIVHGIPSRKVRLEDGDILSVDCGVVLDGFFGDAAISIGIGNVNGVGRKLMTVTRECLDAAVEQVGPGKRLGDIGEAVQSRAEGAGFGVVREFVGHGIGRSLHEEPQVPNYGQAGRGQVMKPGLVVAIEPMITAGSWRVKIDDDGWTARTEDG